MMELWIGILLAWAAGRERVVESVVPGLAYGAVCSSVVEVANLGSRPAVVDVEGHRASGALDRTGPDGNHAVLPPDGSKNYRLAIEEETTGAWIKVREWILGPDQSPAIAARGVVECVDGDRLRTAGRDATFPMRNPWFAADADSPGATIARGVVLVINAGEQPAQVAGCYSAGNLYSLPGGSRSPPGFEPVCSETFDAQVPPFGSREFQVERNGSRWFSLRTRGPSIVLQVLRPVEASVRMFVVDSTIQFGHEVPPDHP